MSIAAARKPSPFASAEDRERERKEKRAAVLTTAASMFCRRGYTATQMADVAAELGVTKPTIYYYFRNKEDVLVACFEVGFEQIQATLREAEGRNGRERLRRVLIAYAELMGEDFGKCTVQIPVTDLSEESRKRVNRQKRRFDDQVRALVREAVEDGSIGPCDPKLATFTILGSLNAIGLWHKPEGAMSPTEIAEAVVEQLFRGLDKR